MRRPQVAKASKPDVQYSFSCTAPSSTSGTGSEGAASTSPANDMAAVIATSVTTKAALRASAFEDPFGGGVLFVRVLGAPPRSGLGF